MFRPGTVGLICAAYEVEITAGTEHRQGTIRPVRDCTNLATERVVSGECVTGLCPDCADALANSPGIGVVEKVIRRRTTDVAIRRAIILIPHQGDDQCCALDIAHESGTDLGTARLLGICAKPPAGALTKIGSALCADHIEQYDREGGFVLA
jgi:hypothetical protein